MEFETAAVAEREHAGEVLRHAALRLEFRDHPVTRPAKILAGVVIDRIVGDWKEVGLANRDAGRERHRDAQLAARDCEVADGRKRLRKRVAPFVELRAVGSACPFWHIKR